MDLIIAKIMLPFEWHSSRYTLATISSTAKWEKRYVHILTTRNTICRRSVYIHQKIAIVYTFSSLEMSHNCLVDNSCGVVCSRTNVELYVHMESKLWPV